MATDRVLGAHPEWQEAGMRVVVKEHFGPASYSAANKEILVPSAFSMSQFFTLEVLDVLVTDSTGAVFGTVRGWKHLAGNGVSAWKLVYYDTAGTEIANAVDLSGKRITIRALGV